MNRIAKIMQDRKIAKAVTLPLCQESINNVKNDRSHIYESGGKSEIRRSNHMSAQMKNNKNQKSTA